MNATVVGREDELAAVEAFLGRIQAGPSALVLSGEPGIGKTTLWEVGVEEAERRVEHVLVHRSTEAEAHLSFTGLSDLLGGVFEEVAPSLVPLRRRVLEVALRLAEPGDQPLDMPAVGLAMLDVLRLLAERRPVLIALDDVQWLDPASAGVLQIALRRLRNEPVGVLVTLRRAPEIVALPLELEQAFGEARAERLPLPPLSLGALHGLLRERLELELSRPELTRMHEMTAGNPFFALELGRELVRTGTRPTAGQALRVPENLRGLLGDRLARLPGETIDVLLEIAALARPTIDVVSAAHGDRERVLRAVEAAEREGVVELDEPRVRFVHPLLASICYEEAPRWKRRAVHHALADAVSDIEERARHKALAVDGPDPAVAAELDAAADQAAARGATAAAADLCELAASLISDDPPRAREQRLRAANFHRLAGNTQRAVEMLEQLRTEVPPGVERADVLLGLAVTFMAEPELNVTLCEAALAEATGDDYRSARILGFRGGMRLLGGDVDSALADSREALDLAEQVGDPELLVDTIARVGFAEARTSRFTPGLLERGAEIEVRARLSPEYYQSPRFALARFQLRMGELDAPRAEFERMEAEAAARGDEGTRGQALWALSSLEWLAGRWQRAHDLAMEAHELAEQTQHRHGRLWVGRVKALVEADLGLVDEARASAQEALAVSRGIFYVSFSNAVLGRLELSLGNLDGAGDHLRNLPAELLADNVTDPDLPVWADTIETLVALGELERAKGYLDRYSTHAAELGSPLGLERVSRCRGLLAAAEGDIDAGLSAFAHAVTEQPASPWPMERSRTLLALGTVRRQAQQKKAAREALEDALAIFEELGAPLWAEKARAELKRISGRSPASEELTETERRVAELAAQGRTNKQIAAELYMGLSTVEAHLSHVYRKLGVRRAELAAQLSKAQGEPV
jgi:DNA-binding CsgD family transcriptional regulator